MPAYQCCPACSQGLICEKFPFPERTSGLDKLVHFEPAEQKSSRVGFVVHPDRSPEEKQRYSQEVERLMSRDPTTAEIERQNAERDALRADNDRLEARVAELEGELDAAVRELAELRKERASEPTICGAV